MHLRPLKSLSGLKIRKIAGLGYGISVAFWLPSTNAVEERVIVVGLAIFNKRRLFSFRQ